MRPFRAEYPNVVMHVFNPDILDVVYNNYQVVVEVIL